MLNRVERSLIFRGGDHDGVGVDFGDAEVSAEVEKVQRAEHAGDLDDVHVARGADEYGDVVDLGSVEVDGNHCQMPFVNLRH